MCSSWRRATRCSRSPASSAPSAGSTAPIAGSYRETLNNPALNLDIAQTRRGRIKYGYVVNLEQAITDDIGLFGRWSWNDGQNEIMAFTDIDASLSLRHLDQGNEMGPAR